MTNDKVKVVRYAVGIRKVGEPKGTWAYVNNNEGTIFCGAIPFPFIPDQLDAHRLGLKLAQRPDVAEVTVRARTVTVLASTVQS